MGKARKGLTPPILVDKERRMLYTVLVIVLIVVLVLLLTGNL
jgi:hypothetical protein